MNNIVVIIQARMGSTRLPNKMAMDICGKTVLGHVISRIKKCKEINDVIVATSIKERDNVIEEIAKEEDVNFYRGSEENVLQRFKEANDKFGGEIVIRMCADSPLIDSEIVDYAIRKFLEVKPDYLTTTIKRTFPEGLDVEVFSKETLDRVYRLAKEQEDLEHVTFYIRKNQDVFKCYNLEAPEEFKHPEIKLTLDTKKDFIFIKSIFESLYPKNKDFDTKDILNFLVKKYKFIFRVDSSHQLGMGDVISMLNLAQGLKDSEILFISKYDEGINKIKEFEYNVEKIPENVDRDGEIDFIKKLNDEFKADMIIIELVEGNNQDYYRKLSEVTKTLIIDFFGNIEIYSDVIVNWDIFSENQNYIKKNENTIYCLGPQYALLKQNIIKYSNLDKEIKDRIENVLITMGGSDLHNLTPRIINSLKEFKDIKFNVVVGPAFKNKEEIKQVLENSGLNYHIIENLDNLFELIYNSDLVISAGGFTSFELCVIGTPFIAVSNAEWELKRLKKMEELGICKFLGVWSNFNTEDLYNNFKDLLENKEKRQSMSINGKKLSNGDGVNRVVEIIKRVVQNGNKTNN